MPTQRREPALIALVDDNEDCAESLAMYLGLFGFRVCIAHDGQRGLAMIREKCPAAAVLDIGLPHLDGYALARRIREEVGECMPLVAVSGWGKCDDVAKAHEAGFNGHFTKPADPNVIGEWLVAQLDHRE